MKRFKFYDKGSCNSKFLVSAFLIFFFPSLLFAANSDWKGPSERQVLNDLAVRFLQKANLSPKNVIVLIEKDTTKKRTKLDNIISEALQSAISMRATLASREMMAEAQNEITLNEKLGQYRFLGTPIGRMKTVDYFVWAEIQTIGSKTATVKMTLLNVKTHIVESFLAEDIALQPTSLAQADLDLNLYGKWLKERNESRDLRISGMWESAWAWLGFSVVSTYTTCTDEQLAQYSDPLDCSAGEYPDAYAIESVFLVGIIVAGVRWYLGAEGETAAEKYRLEQNWPEFTFEVTPVHQKMAWAWKF